MSKYQPTPRYSLTRGASAARQINSNRTIASHVLETTIEYTGTQPVVLVRSHESRLIGNAVLLADKQCYLVASKFAGRMYVVTSYKGVWQCSSKDEAVARLMIGKAQTYRAELLAAQSERANMKKLANYKIGSFYEDVEKKTFAESVAQ